MTEHLSGFKSYRKHILQWMRDYIPGEDLTGVSVAPGVTPAAGGMIAFDPLSGHKWFVPQAYFLAAYVEAEP